MQKGTKRRDGERDFPRDGWIAQIAEAQIEQLANVGCPSQLAAALEHRRRAIDADHWNAGLGNRNGDPACADAELEHRPARE